VLHFVWTGSLLSVWGAAIAVSGAVLAAAWRSRAGVGRRVNAADAQDDRVHRGARADATRCVRAPRWLLPLLMLLCATTVAVAHRADHDDAFYLNIAVAAADDPQAPLLAGDTLHGYHGVPLGLPVFRVLSYELGLAISSLTTGVDALVLAHVVWPPFFAALIPLAWARLLRMLAPRVWPWLLAGVLASFFLLADGRATHGEFALLRLQQGKSIFLAVIWPLIACFGLDFGARPNTRRWCVLAASKIAAVGLSTNALWLAPAIGGLGVFAGVFQSRREAPDGRGPNARSMLATLALGALASLHAVVMAIVLREDTLRAFEEAAHPLPSLRYTSSEFMAEAVDIVAGSGTAAGLCLFALVAAPAIAPTTRLRTFMAAFTLATCGLFWNPAWAHLVATQITGPDTYFRVLWLWPVPIAMALLICAGVTSLARKGRDRTWTGAGAFTLGALGVFFLGGGLATIAPANGVSLHAPAVKIEPDELDLARALTHYAGPDDFVLAPVDASRWLPLLHAHPHPLVVREMLLDVLDERLGQRELTLRAQLTRVVGGGVRLPKAGELLAHEIESVPLQAVALAGAARNSSGLLRALTESPLERVESNEDWEIWARPAAGSEALQTEAAPHAEAIASPSADPLR
jgi:hypothetical protein